MFLKLVYAKYQVEAILSKDDFSYYHEAFFNSFDRNRYKKIINKLVALFKTLNGGKPSNTVVVDFGGGTKPLRRIDKDMIEALKILDYQITPESYLMGLVVKEGKSIPIMDILKTRASKIRGLAKKKEEYEKTKNEKIKKEIDFYENVIELGLITEEGKIDIQRLAIYENKKGKMVFSYNLRAIASQSTEQGWESCMDLQRYYDYGDKDPDGGGGGRYVHLVGAGASAGTFVCYLVKAGDELTIDHPTARVLFKPYFGQKTGDVLWKCDKIYGSAPENFREAAQAVIDKIQKPKPDIYKLTEHTYVDNLNQIEYRLDWDKMSQKELYEQMFKINDDVIEKNILPRLKDQIFIAKLLKEGDLHLKIWEKVCDKCTNQTFLNNLILDENLFSEKRKYAVKKVKNKNFLKRIALSPKIYNNIREEAIFMLNDPDLAIQIIIEQQDKDKWFARNLVYGFKKDENFLKQIIANDKIKTNVKSPFIDDIKDISPLKDFLYLLSSKTIDDEAIARDSIARIAELDRHTLEDLFLEPKLPEWIRSRVLDKMWDIWESDDVFDVLTVVLGNPKESLNFREIVLKSMLSNNYFNEEIATIMFSDILENHHDDPEFNYSKRHILNDLFEEIYSNLKLTPEELDFYLEDKVLDFLYFENLENLVRILPDKQKITAYEKILNHESKNESSSSPDRIWRLLRLIPNKKYKMDRFRKTKIKIEKRALEYDLEDELADENDEDEVDITF